MPISIKGRQVNRYYRLLSRLGFDAIFDAMTQSAQTAPPATPGPTAAGEMSVVEPGTVDLAIAINFGDVFRACAGADADPGSLSALDELAAAVLDLDDETAAAGEWDTAEVAEKYGPFTEASAGLLKLLMQPQFGLA